MTDVASLVELQRISDPTRAVGVSFHTKSNERQMLGTGGAHSARRLRPGRVSSPHFGHPNPTRRPISFVAMAICDRCSPAFDTGRFVVPLGWFMAGTRGIPVLSTSCLRLFTRILPPDGLTSRHHDRRTSDELREVCPMFVDLQGARHMNPSPRAESRGLVEASPGSIH